MPRLIYRDPFARSELHRRVAEPLNAGYYGIKHTCKWCGGTNKQGKLYQYWYEKDSVQSHRNYVSGFFCSVSCMRAYNQ